MRVHAASDFLPGASAKVNERIARVVLGWVVRWRIMAGVGTSSGRWLLRLLAAFRLRGEDPARRLVKCGPDGGEDVET